MSIGGCSVFREDGVSIGRLRCQLEGWSANRGMRSPGVEKIEVSRVLVELSE